MDKFIYVFSEADKNTLLLNGYTLIKEPKQKKSSGRPKKGEDEKEDQVEKEEVKYWVFANKTVRDLVFSSLENYVFSDTLTF